MTVPALLALAVVNDRIQTNALEFDGSGISAPLALLGFVTGSAPS